MQIGRNGPAIFLVENATLAIDNLGSCKYFSVDLAAAAAAVVIAVLFLLLLLLLLLSLMMHGSRGVIWRRFLFVRRFHLQNHKLTISRQQPLRIPVLDLGRRYMYHSVRNTTRKFQIFQAAARQFSKV